MRETVQAPLKDWPNLAKISLLFCLGAIMLNTFMRSLIDVFTPFFIVPIYFAALAGPLLLLLVSLLYIPYSWKRYKQKSFLPLLINVLTPVMFLYVPLDRMWIDFTFWLNRHEYQYVVQLVEEGYLASAEGIVELPPEYCHLTTVGDEIMIDRDNGVVRIFFFTYRGFVFTTSSGHIYRSDGLPCQNGDFNTRWFKVEPKRPNWFYCTTDD